MSNKFRAPVWLQRHEFGPQIFLYRNIESGQVLYSQLPNYTDYQIKTQFQRPNWENKKPAVRRDLWRIMAVAEFANHYIARDAYEGLVQLRHMREVTKRDEAEQLRKRNEWGNIWYSAQFRPTYTQEAVADLSTVIEEFQVATKISWENLWRKGADEHWDAELVEHEEIPSFNPRDQHVVLNTLRESSFAKYQESAVEQQAYFDQLKLDNPEAIQRKPRVTNKQRIEQAEEAQKQKEVRKYEVQQRIKQQRREIREKQQSKIKAQNLERMSVKLDDLI